MPPQSELRNNSDSTEHATESIVNHVEVKEATSWTRLALLAEILAVASLALGVNLVTAAVSGSSERVEWFHAMSGVLFISAAAVYFLVGAALRSGIETARDIRQINATVEVAEVAAAGGTQALGALYAGLAKDQRDYLDAQASVKEGAMRRLYFAVTLMVAAVGVLSLGVLKSQDIKKVNEAAPVPGELDSFLGAEPVEADAHEAEHGMEQE